MVSDTITAQLIKYGIGNRLRRLRLRKSMSLRELGKHTGLSIALLSKLEREQMCPTIPTLVRIGLVFSVDLDYFFNSKPKPVLEIVRKKDRLRFPNNPDANTVDYHFESLDFPVNNPVLNTFLAEFNPVTPEQCQPHKHPGVEVLYVISGKLELRVDKDIHELSEGDAIYFDSGVPHSYRRIGAKSTTAMVVVLPAGSFPLDDGGSDSQRLKRKPKPFPIKV
jgi:transcriptional regulator with XRE-family HTH domain